MEKKLKKLFDYQCFEKNERLEKIIKETESRYGGELFDDDLSLVNAAGETGGSISDYNTGGLTCSLTYEVRGLTGSLTDEVGGLIGTPFGTKGGVGGGGAGGKNPAM